MNFHMYQGKLLSKQQETQGFESTISILQEMRIKQVDTDVIIVCKDGELAAHRLLLAARSPFLRKLFQNSNRVDFFYTNQNVMNAVLNFIYGIVDNFNGENNFEEILQFYEISNILEIEELSIYARQCLVKEATFENCILLWDKFLLYDHKMEADEMFAFVVRNLKEIVTSNYFLSADKFHLKLLFQYFYGKKLRCEAFLFEALIKWCKHDENRIQTLLDIMCGFRFDLISKECMKQILTAETFLLQDESVANFLNWQVIPDLKSEYELVTNKNIDDVVIKKFKIPYSFERQRHLCNLDDEHGVYMSNLFYFKALEEFFPKVSFVVDCYQWDLNIVFRAVNQIDNSQIILIYDLKNLNILTSTVLPTSFQVEKGYAEGDNVYFVGYWLDVEKTTKDVKMFVQIYSINKTTWNVIELHPANILSFGGVSDPFDLLILCERDEFYYMEIITVNEMITHEYEPAEFLTEISRYLTIKKELITVFDENMYFFFPTPGKSMDIIIYTFNEKNWERTTIPFFESSEIIECQSFKERGIILVSATELFFLYCPQENTIKNINCKISSINKYLNSEIGTDIYIINERII